MKTKAYSVTTVMILVIALLCTGICAWQTVNLISHQDVFSAEHPDYIPHSWYLLGLLLSTVALACGQTVLRDRIHPVLCGSMSVVMIVLEVLDLRAAADQHYHLGMLISDYGLQVPFAGGWLLLILVAGLLIAAVIQLLILFFSALAKPGEAQTDLEKTNNIVKNVLQVIFNIFIAIAVTFAIVFGGIFLLFFGSYEHVETDIAQYNSDISKIGNADKFMPDLNSLTGYTDMEYTYKFRSFSIFCSDGFALFVTYDKDQYEAYKNEAISNYTFLQEPVLRSGDTYELPVTEFRHKGYHMKVVPDEEYLDFCACKSFMLLGFNDEECKIAYLYHYDFDIDYIAEAGENLEAEMSELVDEVFFWVD